MKIMNNVKDQQEWPEQAKHNLLKPAVIKLLDEGKIRYWNTDYPND